MSYKVVIGLEMHCELSSNRKVFSPSKNAYSDLANSNVSAIDMAFPGTLPLVNKKCVKDAIKMASVLNCKIADYMMFDRKNYYYPDLPKGYQITQFTSPVGTNGHIDIESEGKVIGVDIHDIHLEEDTASMEHLEESSLLDYNRSGVPLLELVTEPCLHSAQDAITFLEYMRSAYRYLGISEADSKKGQVRCDVNISIMEEGATELGTRVEIKNVNSFSNVFDAINYEVKRQTELKEQGKYDEVEQETRRWDETTSKTIRMRSKADAIDYKYFVEPNIPRYKISEEWINEIRKEIPRLRDERKNEYITKYNLSEKESTILVKEKEISDYFEKVVEVCAESKDASNWISTKILGYMNEHNLNINEIYMTPDMLGSLINLVKEGKISSQQAKDVFAYSLEEEKTPLEIVKEKGMEQISDEGAIRDMVNKVIDNNPSQLEAYKSGKTALLGFFVGQTLKESQGKANPSIVNKLVNEELNKR